MQRIFIIVAIDSKRGIGKAGTIPWKLPADLAYFKDKTTGHTVVMGRKTYESIGRPLPNRKNIILTRDREFQAPDGCAVIYSVDEIRSFDGDVYIIGGSEVYGLFLPKADAIFITEVEGDFSADTFFPDFDRSQWDLVSAVEGVVDEKNIYPHRFLEYRRKV